ncbi:hypothetical protein FH972_020903 [Carpinus fangiana]|uniref:Uncharacterized protein n=1 Tax=Carpinus fangiana TaxID=176857 RepID=A0A5N6RX03_9ROSI|nr:hypothetical protein FH972_020903 [Carpinus fangiana]
MRPFLALSLLLLCLLLSHEAQGIRLDKMFMSLGQQKQHEADGNALIAGRILCKDGEHCSGTMKKRVSRVLSKKSHHWLPSIHEDYYGPRSHRPRHH